MGVTLAKTLPEALRRDGARLYWEAFGGKLGLVLGPETHALIFFERVIRADHCMIATDRAGELVGLAGFKTPQGSFAGGSWADLHAVYGWWGGLWRGSVLWALNREVDNDRFLVDGICVSREARGKGIGTALLAALYVEAGRRGYTAVRLDVVEENWRARALYEREGFVVTTTTQIGLLSYLFGFRASLTMVRPLVRDRA